MILLAAPSSLHTNRRPCQSGRQYTALAVLPEIDSQLRLIYGAGVMNIVTVCYKQK